MRLKAAIILSIVILSIAVIGFYFLNLVLKSSKASAVKANIFIDTKKVAGPVFPSWKAIAQGGEEIGVRMLQNVVPQLSELKPRYIRIDHIYDFYNVVGRSNGPLTFDWKQLDDTVCDILATGAKPFFSLGYMPSVISNNNTPIGRPQDWNDWALIVQRTVEHYSGRNTVLCDGQFNASRLIDVYYEVWNEPDLEIFGKWTKAEYNNLYKYSSIGATNAQNVNNFLLGGPATTSLYQNWIESFLYFAAVNNLRVDFISWHHYSNNPNDFTDDGEKLNQWLTGYNYSRFANLPKIISEWGYDSSSNPLADTDGGAAYSIASIRNLMNQKLEMAFTFEAKDGPVPRWGILTNDGKKKPRFNSLKLLNLLQGFQLTVEGEGNFVRAIASLSPDNRVNLVLVNYDPNDQHDELVPVTFFNLENGNYQLILTYSNGMITTFDNVAVMNNQLQRSFLMKPNMVLGVELKQK